LRDTRPILIRTGTNEIMNLLIQHECPRKTLSRQKADLDVKKDAQGADYAEGKVYE